MGLGDFLFGKNRQQINQEYSDAIKDTEKQMADASYQDAYNRALYDANKELFDKQGIKDYSEAFGSYADTSKAYQEQLDMLQKEKDTAWKRNKYNVAGNGLIGALVNPFVQVGSQMGELGTDAVNSVRNIGRMAKGEELIPTNQRYRRDEDGDGVPDEDFVSDLGAIGEAGLTLADLFLTGGAVSAGKTAAKGGAKALTNNALKSAAKIGAVNAGQAAAGTLREQGSDVSLGDMGLSAAIGGGLGAAMGGLSTIGGNAANIARANRASGAVTTPLARTGLGRVGQGVNETLNLGRFTPKRSTAMKVGAGVGGGLLLSKLLGGNKNQTPNATGMTDEEIYNYIYGGGQ